MYSTRSQRHDHPLQPRRAPPLQLSRAQSRPSVPRGAGRGTSRWPGSLITSRFHTVAANLRTALRSATGTKKPVIERVAKRYQLQADLFDVDLRRFTDQIGTPGGAAALDPYTGDFDADADADATWVLGPHQTLRRFALDAISRLSAAAPTPIDAVRIAEHALTIDPYDEAGYQLVIGHPLTSGDIAAPNRTYALLQARRAELDLAPSLAVTNLVRRWSLGHVRDRFEVTK